MIAGTCSAWRTKYTLGDDKPGSKGNTVKPSKLVSDTNQLKNLGTYFLSRMPRPQKIVKKGKDTLIEFEKPQESVAVQEEVEKGENSL